MSLVEAALREQERRRQDYLKTLTMRRPTHCVCGCGKPLTQRGKKIKHYATWKCWARKE